MFYKFHKFLNSFTRFAGTFGFGRAVLMSVAELTKMLAVPRHEMVVKLINGCKLLVVPNDVGISAELRVFKTHEPLATDVLVKELRSGMVVVDIGSNIGYYVTLESKLVGKDGTVIAVEPVPLNFSYLLRNIRLNKLTNVISINKAIADRNGTIKILRSKGSNWSRVLQSNQDLFSSDIIDVIQVQAITLDTLIKQHGLKELNLIRMDVEGYEDYIIAASKNALQKYLPDIFIEIHHSLIGRKRLVNLLTQFHDMGYITKYAIPRNADGPLTCRKKDVISKNPQLIYRCPPDVLSLYLTARKD